MSDLGLRADQARAILGEAEGREVSWNEVAKRAGVTSGYISKVKYGDRKRLSYDVLDRIATALGCDLHWLATGHGQPYPARQLTRREPKTPTSPPEDDERAPASRSGVQRAAAADSDPPGR